MSTEPDPVISPSELAERSAHDAVHDTEVIEVDEVAERANAAAASRASVEAARPHDPRPSTVDDPVRVMSAALREVLETMPDDKYTPVVLPLPELAQAGARAAAGLPAVPAYNEHDTPAERFYDRVGGQLREGDYVPTGVVPGGLPTGRSAAVVRVADGVAIPIRPAGLPRHDPELIMELDLHRAFGFALAILSACYAPEPEPGPEADTPPE